MTSDVVAKQAGRQVGERVFQRQIGSYGGATPGPLVVCIGGIHGNEPAGVLALQHVLRQLQQLRPPFKGKLVALAGNVRALKRRQRYLQHDLNRVWLPERVWRLKSHTLHEEETAELSEQRELLAAIEAELAGKYTQAVFLDLHTTSAAGAPFALISDTLANRHYALQLRTPIILGLEESIEGTILNYINELGHVAIGFEAGQHEALLSVKNHEAAIWITLVAAGCLRAAHVPSWAGLQLVLREASWRLSAVLEVRYRHAITEDDHFVMKPGCFNFQRVARNQLLAKDRRGEIRAPERGHLFMPLYQQLGEDGFFLVREIKPFWLRVSAWLRHLKVDRSLAWWPGVHGLAGDENTLLIDTRVARWFVIEICHLLGFRKHSQVAGKLLVTRRRQQAA
jgi:predicted deacylase